MLLESNQWRWLAAAALRWNPAGEEISSALHTAAGDTERLKKQRRTVTADATWERPVNVVWLIYTRLDGLFLFLPPLPCSSSCPVTVTHCKPMWFCDAALTHTQLSNLYMAKDVLQRKNSADKLGNRAYAWYCIDNFDLLMENYYSTIYIYYIYLRNVVVII